MRNLNLSILVLLGLSLGAVNALADDEWAKLADEAVVEVITQDENGDLRETKVWVVAVEGALYLRTSRSKWLANLIREPRFSIRDGATELDAVATVVEGDDIIEAVDAASRVKYGWQERLIHLFRLRKPDILRIEPAGAP